MSCDLSGDYDALLVLMLLPRLLFKAELIVDQLKQQHKVDDALGSLGSVPPAQTDQLTFACLLIYKLSSLQMLINRANWSVLCGNTIVCELGWEGRGGGRRESVMSEKKERERERERGGRKQVCACV